MKLFLLLIFLSSIYCGAQDFEKQFKQLAEKKDTAAMLPLLKQWEKQKPNDAEMFIAYFNYYAIKSSQEVVMLTNGKQVKEGFTLTDSSGKDVGELSSSIYYNDSVLQKGFDYINKGIALYPKRLDMRFGKIYMFGESENYESFTKTILETIDFGNTINFDWQWKYGKPLQDSKAFFLNSMQSYVNSIYNTENDSLLPFMRQISETVLKYFPEHIESLANVALTYLLMGDYDKALTYLLKAESITPKDIIVLHNIAEAYKLKNDKEKAKQYYEKIMRYGNEQEKKEAKKKINQLNQ